MATSKVHRLTEMPTEVLLHTFSFLSPDCSAALPACRHKSRDKRTLARLSLTSRRLRDVAQPILFHCFPDSHWKNPVHRLVCLARTLAARPDLAQHMKYINIRNPLEGLSDLNDADKQYVESELTRLGLPAVNRYWNVDGEGEYRLLPLELLLLRTPSLATLLLPLDYNWDLHAIPQLVNHPDKAKRPPPFLPHLRHLEVDSFFIAGDRFESSLAAVNALARAAPGLETLSLPTPASEAWFPSRGRLRVLRALHFQSEVRIDADLLAHMLESAPALEVLTLHLDALVDAQEQHGKSRSVEALWEVLEVRADTLRELWLDVRADAVPPRGGRREHGIALGRGLMHGLPLAHGVGTGQDLGFAQFLAQWLVAASAEEFGEESDEEELERDSLADFEKLEVLKVDGHALSALRRAWERKNRHPRVDGFLAGMFPPGIREVTFWRLDGLAMCAAMQEFASVVAVGGYPRLEKVRLAPSQGSDSRRGEGWVNQGAWNAAVGALTEKFARGGVTFELAAEEKYWTPGRFNGWAL